MVACNRGSCSGSDALVLSMIVCHVTSCVVEAYRDSDSEDRKRVGGEQGRVGSIG